MGLLVVVVKLINFQRAIFQCPGTEVSVYCSLFLIDGLIIIVILIINFIKVMIVIIMIVYIILIVVIVCYKLISQCPRSESILPSS